MALSHKSLMRAIVEQLEIGYKKRKQWDGTAKTMS
jgi:hypothetical protein